MGERRRFVYLPAETFYAANSMPGLRPGWRIVATIDVTEGAPNGPILVQGDLFGGQALLLEKGRPVFLHNPLGGRDQLARLAGDEAIAPGRHTITVEAASEPDRAVKLSLLVDGDAVASLIAKQFRANRGGGYVGYALGAPFLPNLSLPRQCECGIEQVVIEAMAPRA
jgi:hypothetical protein